DLARMSPPRSGGRYRRRSAAEPGVGGRAEPVRGPTARAIAGGAQRGRGEGEERDTFRALRGAGPQRGGLTAGSPGRGKPRNGTGSAERWIWNPDGGTIFGREHDPGRRPRGGDDFGRHSLGVSRVRAQASDATV